MSIARISSRYAKPLLELAEQAKAVDAVWQDMTGFNKVCSENKDFVLMLKSPIINNFKKAAILKAVFGKNINKITASFFEIVTSKNRAAYLPDIAKEFVTQYNVKMGFQEATVTTTLPLDDHMRKAFEKLVTDISGKKPMLKEKINPELIGGYTIQLGDQKIDDSVHGHLNELKLKFQKESL